MDWVKLYRQKRADLDGAVSRLKSGEVEERIAGHIMSLLVPTLKLREELARAAWERKLLPRRFPGKTSAPQPEEEQ